MVKNITDFGPPVVRAMFEALLKLNENSTLGSFLGEVEQQELLIETSVTPEEIRLERLIGNEHSNPNQK